MSRTLHEGDTMHRQSKDDGKERSFGAGRAFSSTRRRTSDSIRTESRIRTRIQLMWRFIFAGERNKVWTCSESAGSGMGRTVRGWQLRQLTIVATLGGVSRLPSVFSILFCQTSGRWWWWLEGPRDLVVEATTTKWPGGQSDHDRYLTQFELESLVGCFLA